MKTVDDQGRKIGIFSFRIEDYDRLISLWQDADLPYKPKGRDRRESIERELNTSGTIFLVAEREGELIGSIFGSHDGRKGWINRLAVAPAQRRQGLGARLVREVEERLHDLGIEIIACLIEDWNTVSMEAFQRMGYKRHDDIVYLSKRKNPDV